MSENPAYPDAHPTAPGGMSQQALADELLNTHGWEKADIATFKTKSGKAWAKGSWPLMIDEVVAARRERELEAAGAQPAADDLDDLLAELDAEDSAAKPAAAEPESDTPETLLVLDDSTFDYIFNGHAGAGPSGSDRWMNCTASLRLSREFLETLTPNQQAQFAVANAAARQGTTAHTLGETRVLEAMGLLTDEEVESTIMELTLLPETEGESYSAEMEDYVSEYVDLVRQLHNEGRDISVEQRVAAAVWLTGSHDGEVYEIRGSADAIGKPSPEHPDLVVVDLKYGEGVDVEVTENSQARIYALGVLGELADDEGNLPDDLDQITYYIVQPRLGGIKQWTEPLNDLLLWRDDVLAPALTAALYGEGAEFNPSDVACQWCPARGTCAALAAQRVEAAGDLFDEIVETEFAEGAGALPDAGAMTNDRLGEVLAMAMGLTKLVDDLKDEAKRRLYRGQHVEGFKLVSYTPSRKWKPEAEEALDETPEMWETKLLSPTKALKLLGDAGEAITHLIDYPDKYPVVAPAKDRRKDWTGPAPEAMFADETGE